MEHPGVLYDALAFVMAQGFTTLRSDPADVPGAGSVSSVLAAEPDVVLLSFGATSRPGGELLVEGLTARSVPVVVMVTPPRTGDPARGVDWDAAGAASVVPADGALLTLVDALTAASGRPVASVGREHSARQKLSTLTSDEQDVLAALETGATIVEVAQWRGSTEATVRAQVDAILEKLEVSSILSALGIARLATRPIA